MTAFISICIVLGTSCVCLLSAQPEVTVSKPVGSTAILPCQLTSVKTDTPHIKWSSESEVVFERAGNDKYQGEGYEGRVDVPVEELRKRNCSLVLRDLTLTDTGVYTCYQRNSRNKRSIMAISSVKLSVQTEERKPSGKAVGRSGDKSGFSGNGGRNLHYLWLLVLPGLVLPGLVV